MLPGLIFDLDGTLVDSLPGIAASLNRSLEIHGLPTHDPAAVRGFIGNGSLMLARRALPDGSDPSLAEAVEQSFREDYAVTWPDGTSPYPGIPECLKSLEKRGFRLAVLSNKPHPFTVEIVTRVFPGIPFDPVLGQRAEVPQKPQPEGALQIARQWVTAPSECLFIGDSTVDLETARNAGMTAIAVCWGYHDREALQGVGADQWVENVTDLAEFLATC